jgi:glycyl-tRNA synthetase beta chain
VARSLVGSQLLDEVPDLVEYPAVVSGTFAAEFLSLPEEVLTTTMIHHQHFFPAVNDQGQLLPVFLAVLNMQPEKPEPIAKNLERVLTARLRDARFFYEADRRDRLEARLPRLGTVLFHKNGWAATRTRPPGSPRWRWIRRRRALGAPQAWRHAGRAGRLCKADLATDMVRELTELQGTMGGIYARAEGGRRRCGARSTTTTCRSPWRRTRRPSRAQLGPAARHLGGRLARRQARHVVGMFAAGERPTGSRDPYGLRRQAHGVFRVLVDLPQLTGLSVRPPVGALVDAAAAGYEGTIALDDDARTALMAFLSERLAFVLEGRGYDVRNVRAVMAARRLEDLSPLVARRMLEVLPEFTGTPAFRQLATAFKRVKNIARELPEAAFAAAERDEPDLGSLLREPAEIALHDDLQRRRPVIEGVLAAGENYRAAFAEAAAFAPAVDRFFTEVFVMVDDGALRQARLRLMTHLAHLILTLADISEIVPQTES